LYTWDRYAEEWAALHGGVDPRRARPEVRRYLRGAYEVGRVLTRLRVPPLAVTVAGLVLALATPAFAVRHGWWPLLSAGLVLASAAVDSLDGAVALISSRTTPLGYLCDGLADRVVEACWLAALWLVGAPGWVVTICLALSWLHEYVRARAIGAGMTEIGAVTVAERPTRVTFVAIGLTFAALGGSSGRDMAVGFATLFTAVWAPVALAGLVQLLIAVFRGLHRGGLPGLHRAGLPGLHRAGLAGQAALDDLLGAAPTQDLHAEPGEHAGSYSGLADLVRDDLRGEGDQR
jgi:phosphatidylglycerophosphate synthase